MAFIPTPNSTLYTRRSPLPAEKTFRSTYQKPKVIVDYNHQYIEPGFRKLKCMSSTKRVVPSFSYSSSQRNCTNHSSTGDKKPVTIDLIDDTGSDTVTDPHSQIVSSTTRENVDPVLPCSTVSPIFTEHKSIPAKEPDIIDLEEDFDSVEKTPPPPQIIASPKELSDATECIAPPLHCPITPIASLTEPKVANHLAIPEKEPNIIDIEEDFDSRKETSSPQIIASTRESNEATKCVTPPLQCSIASLKATKHLSIAAKEPDIIDLEEDFDSVMETPQIIASTRELKIATECVAPPLNCPIASLKATKHLSILAKESDIIDLEEDFDSVETTPPPPLPQIIASTRELSEATKCVAPPLHCPIESLTEPKETNHLSIPAKEPDIIDLEEDFDSVEKTPPPPPPQIIASTRELSEATECIAPPLHCPIESLTEPKETNHLSIPAKEPDIIDLEEDFDSLEETPLPQIIISTRELTEAPEHVAPALHHPIASLTPLNVTKSSALTAKEPVTIDLEDDCDMVKKTRPLQISTRTKELSVQATALMKSNLTYCHDTSTATGSSLQFSNSILQNKNKEDSQDEGIPVELICDSQSQKVTNKLPDGEDKLILEQDAPGEWKIAHSWSEREFSQPPVFNSMALPVYSLDLESHEDCVPEAILKSIQEEFSSYHSHSQPADEDEQRKSDSQDIDGTEECGDINNENCIALPYVNNATSISKEYELHEQLEPRGEVADKNTTVSKTCKNPVVSKGSALSDSDEQHTVPTNPVVLSKKENPSDKNLISSLNRITNFLLKNENSGFLHTVQRNYKNPATENKSVSCSLHNKTNTTIEKQFFFDPSNYLSNIDDFSLKMEEYEFLTKTQKLEIVLKQPQTEDEINMESSSSEETFNKKRQSETNDTQDSDLPIAKRPMEENDKCLSHNDKSAEQICSSATPSSQVLQSVIAAGSSGQNSKIQLPRESLKLVISVSKGKSKFVSCNKEENSSERDGRKKTKSKESEEDTCVGACKKRPATLLGKSSRKNKSEVNGLLEPFVPNKKYCKLKEPPPQPSKTKICLKSTKKAKLIKKQASTNMLSDRKSSLRNGKKVVRKTKSDNAQCTICHIWYLNDIGGSMWLKCKKCQDWNHENCVDGNDLCLMCRIR